MRELVLLVPSLLDLRGRCNRKGLLIVATTLLAIEVVSLGTLWLTGMTLDGPLAVALKLGFLWIAIAGCAKRLHDLGRSAWAMAWAVPATVAWSTAVALTLAGMVGLSALVPSSPWYLASLALSTLPVVAGTVWLHFAKGDQGPNRYGPAPTGLGFSRPSGEPNVPAIGGAAAPAAAR